MAAARLPQDVLCAVFTTLAALDPITPSSPYGWIRQTTHVCRAWRTAALGQASLWADILCAFESSSVTDVLLERSRTAPLVFNAMAHHKDGLLTRDQLKLAVQNIGNVRILVQPGAYPPLSVVFDGCTLPHLEILHVAHIQPTSVLTAPSLRALSLRFCCFSVHAPQLRSLSLRFGALRIRGAAPQVLDILSQTPILEELRISDLPHTSASRLSAHAAVHLVRLRVLRISSPFFDSVFWKKLTLPDNIDLGLHVYNGEEPEQRNIEVSDIFAAVSRHLSAKGLDSLRIMEDSDGPRLVVKLWSSHAQHSAPAFYLDVTVSIYGEDELDLERDLDAFLPHLNLDQITHVDLGQLSSLSVHFNVPIRRILDPLNSVESAILNYDDEHIDFLLPRSYEDPDEGDAGAEGVFPNLRDLTIIDFPCASACKRHLDNLEKAWKPVLDLLQRRKHTTHPIRTLTLDRRNAGAFGSRADFPGWAQVESMHAPWMDKAREYAEVVVSKLSSPEYGHEDEDAGFDWHISGPGFQR